MITSTTQTISSRWPEKFITAEDSSTATAVYVNEFTTASSTLFSSTVTTVIVKDKGRATINGETVLTQYTAVDFDTLAGDAYVQRKPRSADSLAQDRFRNFPVAAEEADVSRQRHVVRLQEAGSLQAGESGDH